MATKTMRCLRRRWSAKQYISGAMLVVLVLIAITASISISLAPAHLTFCITKANIATYNAKGRPENITNSHLNFTLVVTNTSPRTAVRYASMTAKIWFGPPATAAWVRTAVGVPDGWQLPRKAVHLDVSADYGYVVDSPSKEQRPTEDTRVLVVSKVRFGNGLATTSPFTVRSSCLHVDFVYATNFPILCEPTDG